MEIKIKQGLGDVSLGMSAEEVKQLMGQPDDTQSAENAAGEESLILTFRQSATECIFEGSPLRLTLIDTVHPQASLFGQQIQNLTPSSVVKLLSLNGYPDFEEEKEDWGEDRLSFPDAGLDFYFEEDNLTSIMIGI